MLRPAHILAAESSYKSILRLKLARIPLDIFLITLGGFAETTAAAPGERWAWSEVDNALLRELWILPIPRREIARRMRRSLYAVYRYAWVMGLARKRKSYR